MIPVTGQRAYGRNQCDVCDGTDPWAARCHVLSCARGNSHALCMRCLHYCVGISERTLPDLVCPDRFTEAQRTLIALRDESASERTREVALRFIRPDLFLGGRQIGRTKAMGG